MNQIHWISQVAPVPTVTPSPAYTLNLKLCSFHKPMSTATATTLLTPTPHTLSLGILFWSAHDDYLDYYLKAVIHEQSRAKTEECVVPEKVFRDPITQTIYLFCLSKFCFRLIAAW
jgi:hypothetical protein